MKIRGYRIKKRYLNNRPPDILTSHYVLQVRLAFRWVSLQEYSTPEKAIQIMNSLIKSPTYYDLSCPQSIIKKIICQ